jgi:uncharacterized OB-fold protein
MSLLKKDHEAPQAWQGELPVTNRYTAGVAGERFFRAIKERGQILGSRCSVCEITYVPARLFCERCLAALDEWEDVGGRGEVHSFTLLYRHADGTPREEPEIVAFVQLSDGGLVHRLGEVAPESVAIGMPVEAVFKPADDREGSILDILHFRPVKA